uniref:Uncharacterized protein n=1 Tax=Arundo donax TaxID=35708 RepID=A0A0A9FI26_ARUDO
MVHRYRDRMFTITKQIAVYRIHMLVLHPQNLYIQCFKIDLFH